MFFWWHSTLNNYWILLNLTVQRNSVFPIKCNHTPTNMTLTLGGKAQQSLSTVGFLVGKLTDLKLRRRWRQEESWRGAWNQHRLSSSFCSDPYLGSLSSTVSKTKAFTRNGYSKGGCWCRVWMVNQVFITACIVSLRGIVWKNNMVHLTDFAKKLVQIHKCLKGDRNKLTES